METPPPAQPEFPVNPAPPQTGVTSPPEQPKNVVPMPTGRAVVSHQYKATAFDWCVLAVFAVACGALLWQLAKRPA